MFKMFALLIDLLILTISDAMVTCYLFSFDFHMWSSLTQRITHYHLLHYIFENLPQDFAVRLCRRNLLWKFAVAICAGFFVFVNKSFFVYVSKSCLYGSKTFLFVSKTFLFVRFSLLTVFLFAIAVAVMGHRTKYFKRQLH